MPIPEDKKAKTVELVRKAVKQRLEMWETLHEIERHLGDGSDIEGLDDLIENYATGVHEPEAIGQIDASTIVNEVAALIEEPTDD